MTTFKFTVGQKLSTVSLLNNRSAKYLHGHHATVLNRVTDNDSGKQCYVIAEFFMAADGYAGDVAVRPVEKLEEECIPFVG